MSSIDQIEWFTKGNPILAYSFYISAQFIYSWVPIPGLSVFDIAMAFFLKKLWISFLIASFPPWLASMLLFIFSRAFLKKRVHSCLQGNLIFEVLKLEAAQRPWITGCIVNFLYIPSAFKNHLMPITDIGFLQYAIPAVPFYIAFSFLLVMIGDSLKKTSEITSSKGFSEMSILQKINMGVSWFLIIASGIIMIVLGILGKRRLNLLKKQKKMKEIEIKKKLVKVKKFEEKLIEIGVNSEDIDCIVKEMKEFIQNKNELPVIKDYFNNQLIHKLALN